MVNLITHYLWKSVLKPPQNDLKGRMPERSEWLVAEGGAKRNPRYRDAHRDAKNANIGFLGNRFRVLQTLFLGITIFRGLR